MNKFIKVTRINYNCSIAYININYIVKMVPFKDNTTILTINQFGTCIEDVTYKVKETVDEILEQIRNPSYM